MKKKLVVKFIFALIVVAATSNCKNDNSNSYQEKPDRDSLFISLYTRLPDPLPGEWRAEHPEPEQTLEAYKSLPPSIPDAIRNSIYLIPIGYFDSLELKLMTITGKYLQSIFNLKVYIEDPIFPDEIPADSRRNQQLNSGYILRDILMNRLPENATGLMALTSYDLYPEENWNFVFGEANTVDRVGVSSFYRFGDPKESAESFQLCLRRLLATSSHEFMHMLSMQHCKEFVCVLNGSNSMLESDNKPLIICPQCLEKLNFVLQENPENYFLRLQTFFHKYGFEEEEIFCKNVLSAFAH